MSNPLSLAVTIPHNNTNKELSLTNYCCVQANKSRLPACNFEVPECPRKVEMYEGSQADCDKDGR